MLIRIIVTALLTLGTCSAQPLDFASSYQLMLENNQEYQAELVRFKAAGYGVVEERSRLFPQINLTSEYGFIGELNEVVDTGSSRAVESAVAIESAATLDELPGSGFGSEFDFEGAAARQGDYDSGQVSVVLQQSLFDPEKMAALRRAKSERKVAELNLIKLRDALTVQLLEAYMGLLNAQDRHSITQRELDELKNHKQRAQSRFDEKIGSLTDVYEADSRYQLAYADAASAGLDVEKFKTELKVMLSQRVDEVVSIVDEPSSLYDTLDLADLNIEAPEIDIAGMVDVRLAAQEIKTIEFTAKGQRAVFLPKVNVRAQRQYRTITSNPVSPDRDSYQNQIMLQLEVPLFAGFGNYASAKNAGAQLKAEKARYRHTVLRAEQKQQGALLDVKASHMRLVALKKACEASKKGVDLRIQGYLEGLSSNLDLLDAYRDSFRAKRQWRQALYDFIVNRLKYVASSRDLVKTDVEAINGLLKKRTIIDELNVPVNAG